MIKKHDPVLLTESVDGLCVRKEGVYVDATFGTGGHSLEILKRLDGGRLIAFDQDQVELINDSRITQVNKNFRYLKQTLSDLKIDKVSGLLADLGMSSIQLDDQNRGFSFRFNSALDLRMDRQQELSGRDIINSYSENSLLELFRNYGEMRNVRNLVHSILTHRSEKSIDDTQTFVGLLARSVPKGERREKYFAKAFQALRIAVNDELNALKDLLRQSADTMLPGGRIAVISYHSLEDRLVKNFFKRGAFDGVLKKDFMGNKLLTLKEINRKPIYPSEMEISRNSRSRSARLRIAEKL